MSDERCLRRLILRQIMPSKIKAIAIMGLITPIAIFPGLVSVEEDCAVGVKVDEVIAGAEVKKGRVIMAAEVEIGKWTTEVAVPKQGVDDLDPI